LQRYKCKDRNCNFTICFDVVSEKDKKRRFALTLYLEGLGFHSIGRALGVSHVSVLNWIRKYGNQFDKVRNPRSAQIVEMDEMHSYIGHKKIRWIWTCIDRDTKEYIDFVVGDRSSKTGITLWNKVKQRVIGCVFTDYWKAYKEMIPSDQLRQSKGKTNTAENFNSLIRHCLARFRRQTKCYSKSVEMIVCSLKLLMAKQNGMLSIQIY